MIRESFFDHLLFEKRYSPHTVEAYRLDLTQFSKYLDDVYQTTSLNDITYLMIRSWLASLIESGVTPRSVNRKLSTLRTYFKYLLRNGAIKSYPIKGSLSLKIASHLPSFATRNQMEKALDVEDDGTFSTHRDLMIMIMFYSTGMRIAELENLKVNDIDFANLSLKVTGKRNKQRIIPISEILADKLRAYIEQRQAIAYPEVENLIINDEGLKAARTLYVKTVKAYLSEAGVSGRKSPHVLRHTFATLMLNEGADLNAIKEILGHSSLASTQVYTHTSIEKLKLIYNQAHPWAKKKEES